jgi:maltooligosyltrehalose trehalohydrolase
MKIRHRMPFGAEHCQDNQIRFRLWAPKARTVDLCLVEQHGELSLPMLKAETGWFELCTDRARAGSRYKFQIDGGPKVPDPASRFQPDDVHGPSEVVDSESFEWRDLGWKGRPWEEAVIYELHTGTFTPDGTFAGVEKRLDYLSQLGATAIELMPVADFPGSRNWGYDGVLPFAPDSAYGRPEDLKRLVQSAHERGLMIMLDVVYNHFGPEGNYLRSYAPQFFTDRHRTPWGEAINFDGAESRMVREFFINNALYWLMEYQFDGLRFDAVHAIVDESNPDILTELAQTVRPRIAGNRTVHLVLENDNNAARYLRPRFGRGNLYDAQWNDDIHHALHVTVTGEHDGYYADYSDTPVARVARCLTEGFDYQGQPSVFRGGELRGQPSRDLALTSFVSFLQNHDQVGNRAMGERIVELGEERAIRAAMSVMLLSPEPPLLFMGEEFGAQTPFLFFCDFGPELASAVTEGRRSEFARFERFSDPSAREKIPDPSDIGTFTRSKLDWDALSSDRSQDWLRFYRDLLGLRQKRVVPNLKGVSGNAASFEMLGVRAFFARWSLAEGKELSVLANFSESSIQHARSPNGTLLYSCGEFTMQQLGGWSVAWFLKA